MLKHFIKLVLFQYFPNFFISKTLEHSLRYFSPNKLFLVSVCWIIAISSYIFFVQKVLNLFNHSYCSDSQFLSSQSTHSFGNECDGSFWWQVANISDKTHLIEKTTIFHPHKIFIFKLCFIFYFHLLVVHAFVNT